MVSCSGGPPFAVLHVFIKELETFKSKGKLYVYAAFINIGNLGFRFEIKTQLSYNRIHTLGIVIFSKLLESYNLCSQDMYLREL